MSKSVQLNEDPLLTICREAVKALWSDLEAAHETARATGVRDVLVAKSEAEGATPEDRTPLLKRYPSPSRRVLTNIALLKFVYGIPNQELRKRFGPAGLVEKRISQVVSRSKSEATLSRAALEPALKTFDRVQELLLSSKDLDEMDLKEVYVSGLTVRMAPTEAYRLSLSEVRKIDRIKATDAFQAGKPDAVCQVAEIYIAAGALDVAADYLDPAIEDTPLHPGLWFQKARLTLALSDLEARSASHSKILASETTPASTAEAHWRAQTLEDIGRSESLRDQAFDCCIRAMSLMSSQGDYEEAAPSWTTGYGSMRELRLRVLKQVVGGAGRRVAFSFAAPETLTWLEDQAEVLTSAYDELMGNSLIASQEELVALRLCGLEFLRIVAPIRYPTEVNRLIDDVRRLHGSSIAQFVGPFDSLYDQELPTVRRLFFQHVGAVMDRSEQHRLIDELHEIWLAWVEQQRRKTLASVMLNDAVSDFASGRYQEAFDTVRKGRDEGVIDPDVPEHAYALWRTAAGAAKDAAENGADADRDMIVAEVLSDRGMADRASRYDNDTFVDDEGMSIASPLDDACIDAFLRNVVLPRSSG